MSQDRNEFQRVTEVLVRDKATLIRREQELADARRELADARRRVFELEQALIQIADPEVFDLDARAMRAHAQRAVHWAGDRS